MLDVLVLDSVLSSSVSVAGMHGRSAWMWMWREIDDNKKLGLPQPTMNATATESQ